MKITIEFDEQDNKEIRGDHESGSRIEILGTVSEFSFTKTYEQRFKGGYRQTPIGPAFPCIKLNAMFFEGAFSYYFPNAKDVVSEEGFMKNDNRVVNSNRKSKGGQCIYCKCTSATPCLIWTTTHEWGRSLPFTTSALCVWANKKKTLCTNPTCLARSQPRRIDV
jgi:hypothetical protein